MVTPAEVRRRKTTPPGRPSYRTAQPGGAETSPTSGSLPQSRYELLECLALLGGEVEEGLVGVAGPDEDEFGCPGLRDGNQDLRELHACVACDVRPPVLLVEPDHDVPGLLELPPPLCRG